jgi:hypothetical protein
MAEGNWLAEQMYHISNPLHHALKKRAVPLPRYAREE